MKEVWTLLEMVWVGYQTAEFTGLPRLEVI